MKNAVGDGTNSKRSKNKDKKREYERETKVVNGEKIRWVLMEEDRSREKDFRVES